MAEYLYRYDTERDWIYNGHDYAQGKRVSVILNQYPIMKETPMGYWINYKGYSYLDYEHTPKHSLKFVLKCDSSGRKRWAYLDKDKAMNSYIIRKRKQIGYLEESLATTKMALSLAEQGKVDEADVIMFNLFSIE